MIFMYYLCDLQEMSKVVLFQNVYKLKINSFFGCFSIKEVVFRMLYDFCEIENCLIGFIIIILCFGKVFKYLNDLQI